MCGNRQFYQVLAVQKDKKLHLVWDGKLKVKDERRQMASTSVRNLACHIAAVAYANFIPSAKKWTQPEGLPSGCKKLLASRSLVLISSQSVMHSFSKKTVPANTIVVDHKGSMIRIMDGPGSVRTVLQIEERILCGQINPMTTLLAEGLM